MTRTVSMVVATCAIACSEYDVVSAPEPVAGELSTDWTDPSSPPSSTPDTESPPAAPAGGLLVGRRPAGPGDRFEPRDGGGGEDDPEDVEDPVGDVPEGEDTEPGDDLDDPEGGVGDTGGEASEDPDEDLLTNGCTPGYWKQDQHLGSWPAPLVPETGFVDAFGVDAFPGLALIDVLGLGDAELDALGRHATAALLNALSEDVSYPLTDADVIDAFGSAFSAGEYEATKDLFVAYNEDHCPLN